MKSVFTLVAMALALVSTQPSFAGEGYRTEETRECHFQRAGNVVSEDQKASVPFIQEVASLNFVWANVTFYIPANYLIIDMKKELDNQVVHVSYKVQTNTHPYYGQDTVVDRKDFVYGQPITWDIQGGTFSCD